MQITSRGQFGFSLKGSSASVALYLDPAKISDEQIIITTQPVKAGKDQVVFDWPGEYEARGVSVMVFPVGKDAKSNATKVLLDDFACAHLDDLASPLTEADEERLGTVDILFIRIGKDIKLSPKDIQATIEAVDPKLVIPMHYAAGEEKEFAKQFGAEDTAVDTLKLRRSDLPADKMGVKILKTK